MRLGNKKSPEKIIAKSYWMQFWIFPRLWKKTKGNAFKNSHGICEAILGAKIQTWNIFFSNFGYFISLICVWLIYSKSFSFGFMVLLCTFYLVAKFLFFFISCMLFCLQVYKTQLERVSDGWSSKMANFERLNSTLRNSLTELQSENNELKSMVRKIVFTCITNNGNG